MTAITRLAMLALLLAGSACSKRTRNPAPEPARPAPRKPAPPAPIARHPAPPPCPPIETLRPLLARAWKLDPARLNDEIECAPGRFPTPGYVVFGFINTEQDDADTFSRLAVVDAHGSLLAVQDGAPDKERLGSLDELTRLAAADLDGDEVDEIVATHSSSYKYSPSAEAVAVYRMRGRKLIQLLDRGYAFTTADTPDGDEGAPVCSGSWEVTAATPPALVITGAVVPLPSRPTLPPGQPQPACVKGRESYVMRGGRLVAP